MDVTTLFEDPAVWAAFAANVEALFVPDFESVGIGAPQGEVRGIGLDGLRAVFREWLSPWTAYYSAIEDVIGVGDRVMVLVHDRGVSQRDGVEVAVRAASVWTMRDGLIARVEFHTNRDAARRAAGL